MSAATYASQTRGAKPAPLVISAVKALGRAGEALDVGAGSLRNSTYLLENGFSVTAVDPDPVMQEEAARLAHPCLETVAKPIEEVDISTRTFDLIVAMHVLPFIAPDVFDAIFRKLTGALAENGVLCASLFGERDAWTQTHPHMTFHSRSELADMLSSMHVITFTETNTHGHTIDGTPKYWHVFEIIAQKKQ